MVFASIREHFEHCDFFASTSRDKKFACRAASSLESTTREQRALLVFSACSNPYGNPLPYGTFNFERTKFFEASLSDTFSPFLLFSLHLLLVSIIIEGGGGGRG